MRIGITGITTSGKSTLTQDLVSIFGATSYCSDDYYLTEDYPMIDFKEKRIVNWDSPDCICWKKFEESCENARGDLIFIDSFMLFYSTKIASLLDALIILDYKPEDYEVALERRIHKFFKIEGIEDLCTCPEAVEKYKDEYFPGVPIDYITNPHSSKTHWEAAYFREVAWETAMKNTQYREPLTCDKPILRLSAVKSKKINFDLAVEFVNSLLE